MRILESELNQLLEAAIRDRVQEPAFFKALLDATVHAHAPSNDRSGRIRFVQFNGPGGELLLPFFSDLGKALIAASPNVRIVSLPGRTFLESTLGACLILNPNDHWAKLYPEEVRQLLKTGDLAVLDGETVGARLVNVRAPEQLMDGFAAHLRQLLPTLAPLESAYLVEMASAEHGDAYELVIVLVVPLHDRDRIVRAVITELQVNAPPPAMAVSVHAVEVGTALPYWLDLPEIAPFYVR